ncbi:MAG: tRNA pseudouridine(55) synthase TruB [Bacteroidales bacterium]
MEINNINTLKEGSVFLVDKPYTWTSFNVVGKLKVLIRRATGDKSIKVGHAGTLDPLATGLLVVCTGKATKQVNELMAQQKEYIATIKLGETTPSFDLETKPDNYYPTEHISRELIDSTVQNFIGPQDQIPPLFSAKFIDGKRAYNFARKGIDMELKPVPIEIYSMEVLNFEMPYLELNIRCSKGTYIRSIARDIGKALNSGAHLTQLRRTASGDFNIADALTIEDIEKKFQQLCNQP